MALKLNYHMDLVEKFQIQNVEGRKKKRTSNVSIMNACPIQRLMVHKPKNNYDYEYIEEHAAK